MRSLIADRAGQNALVEAASQIGYRSMRYDALKKALLGLTTLEEVNRHTVIEWSH